jgi:hypothetical protein
MVLINMILALVIELKSQSGQVTTSFLTCVLLAVVFYIALANVAEWLSYILPGSLLSIDTARVTGESGEHWALTVFSTLALTAFPFIWIFTASIRKSCNPLL